MVSLYNFKLITWQAASQYKQIRCEGILQFVMWIQFRQPVGRARMQAFDAAVVRN